VIKVNENKSDQKDTLCCLCCDARLKENELELCSSCEANIRQAERVEFPQRKATTYD